MAFDIKPEQFLTSGDVFLNLLKEALTGARTGLARGQELELQKLKNLTTASKALMSARMSKADPYINGRPATDEELLKMLLTGVPPTGLEWKPRPEKTPVSYQTKLGAMETYLGSLERATNWEEQKKTPYTYKNVYGIEIETTLEKNPKQNKRQFLNWVGSQIQKDIYSKTDPLAIKIRKKAERVWDKIVEAQKREAEKTDIYKKWQKTKKPKYLEGLLNEYPALREVLKSKQELEKRIGEKQRRLKEETEKRLKSKAGITGTGWREEIK